ncbi:MAG: hypothetical protein DDT19_01131 [Syntrophomonadaceae bacterium]|nr:hypothetical protein [Bacillota bacterium]
MKILKIIADGDYDALTFEEKFSGQKISDLIAQVENGKMLAYKDDESDEEATELNTRVYDVGEIDERFLQFVRNEVQDYDDVKHSNFYLETQTL